MNGAEQILVIILSTFLAIFLLLGIIIAIFTIKLIKQLQQITQHAEHIAEKAEAVTSMVGKAAGPMAIGKLLFGIIESVRGQTNKRGK
jgi:predicted PurR-regulated permease PerM